MDEGLLRFDEDLRTCEDRPWIWGLHLHARTFALVGLHGIRYRRDVSASLTQLADERQFDFIPAFERIVQQVSADRDAASLLPKALRSYCAVLCTTEPTRPLPRGTTAHTALPKRHLARATPGRAVTGCNRGDGR